MRKLLFFASDFRIGLSALLTDQLIALRQSGIELCAVAGENEQEPGLTEKVRNAQIPITRITGLDGHQDFKRLAQQLHQIILKNKIEVVHVQNNWQLALITYVKFLLLFKQHLKVIYTLHGFRHNSKWKSHIAQLVIGTALLLFADKVICMCTYLKKKFRLLSYKIELLPLGMPNSFFPAEQPPLPLKEGLHMIFPAQFREGKNQDVIIKAFAKYVSMTQDTTSRLILPGTGVLWERMKNLAAELKIDQQVIFPGQCPKEEIHRLYLECNIGIVSSNSETFGQSIVEPFVLGRCVLSTPVGIALDIIHNGTNGYLFTDEKSLTDTLLSLHHSPQQIASIGRNNFLQRNQFKWENICAAYKQLLN